MAERVAEDGTADDGSLTGLFEPRPRFHRRVFGYDRAEVDDYVAWVSADPEVQPAAEPDVQPDGAGTCRCGRSVPAPAATDGRDAVLLVAAMRELLDLARQRADEVVDAALAEAEQIRADARLEADAQILAAGELHAATRERARRDAGALLSETAADRSRLAGEVAALRCEVAGLLRQRDELGDLLARLTGALSSAVDAVSGSVPELLGPQRRDRVVLTGNVVRDESKAPIAG
jgi:colicin import membrane protein